MENSLNWFEIAVTDLDRATRFYEEVLAIKLRREEFHGMALAIFPAGPDGGHGVTGALLRDGKRAPGGGGSVIYLNATGKLDACLERVARAGGGVVTPRTNIGEAGAFALVRDPEGNVIGLHTEPQG